MFGPGGVQLQIEDPMKKPPETKRGRSKTQMGGSLGTEKAFSGVDAYIKGLQKVGSMPLPMERFSLPFDHIDRHNFERIPGYSGFVPGDKCKEKVHMMENGRVTERLSQILSRNIGSSLFGGAYVDGGMPRTVNDEMWSYKVNPEPLTQFSRVRTDVWPTVKDMFEN